MARIEGYEESKKALAEINKIIQEIEEINQFMSIENPSALYKLSFKIKNTDTENSSRKAVQYSAPLVCDDTDGLYRFVRLYKERKVRTVVQLMDTCRISLSEEEKAILGIE